MGLAPNQGFKSMCGELKGPKKARILLVKLYFAGSWQSRDVSEAIDVSRYNTDETVASMSLESCAYQCAMVTAR